MRVSTNVFLSSLLIYLGLINGGGGGLLSTSSLPYDPAMRLTFSLIIDQRRMNERFSLLQMYSMIWLFSEYMCVV